MMRRIVPVVVVLIILVIAGFWWFTRSASASPAQPINYTHNLHADQLAIQCLYCHRDASTGYIAQVPPEEICMGCHRNIAGNTDSAKNNIKKLTDAYTSQTPIVWNRVVDLPDHVGFAHRAHVRNGIQCTECHQREPSGVNWAKFDPGMAWCTTCHSSRGASTDCWTCHK